jgi:hypothetical protein
MTMENKTEKNQNKKNGNQEMTVRTDDAGYTPQEDQFADGKGTQLNLEITPDRGDIEDELSEQVEGTFEDQQFGEEELDEDFKEFKKQNE